MVRVGGEKRKEEYPPPIIAIIKGWFHSHNGRVDNIFNG
jgi:hypothetical protein